MIVGSAIDFKMQYFSITNILIMIWCVGWIKGKHKSSSIADVTNQQQSDGMEDKNCCLPTIVDDYVLPANVLQLSLWFFQIIICSYPCFIV